MNSVPFQYQPMSHIMPFMISMSWQSKGGGSDGTATILLMTNPSSRRHTAQFVGIDIAHRLSNYFFLAEFTASCHASIVILCLSAHSLRRSIRSFSQSRRAGSSKGSGGDTKPTQGLARLAGGNGSVWLTDAFEKHADSSSRRGADSRSGRYRFIDFPHCVCALIGQLICPFTFLFIGCCLLINDCLHLLALFFSLFEGLGVSSVTLP